MPRPNTPDLDLSLLYDLTSSTPKMEKTASSGRLKYAETIERFTKIAFDLFRDNESEFIWKLEKDSETGEEYIVRTAQTDPLFKTSRSWSAEVDSKKTAITLVYRGHAIKAFKKADLQCNDGTGIENWRRFLVDKITTDPTFLTKVLSQVGDARRKFILGKFPELGE